MMKTSHQQQRTVSIECQPRTNDVLSGRGGLSNKHPGNRLFRRLIHVNKAVYQRTVTPSHKQLLVISIMEAIRKKGGRFVRKEEDDRWVEISRRQAAIKTSQALRENTDTFSDGSSSCASSNASCCSSSTSNHVVKSDNNNNNNNNNNNRNNNYNNDNNKNNDNKRNSRSKEAIKQHRQEKTCLQDSPLLAQTFFSIAADEVPRTTGHHGSVEISGDESDLEPIQIQRQPYIDDSSRRRRREGRSIIWQEDWEPIDISNHETETANNNYLELNELIVGAMTGGTNMGEGLFDGFAI